MPDTDLTAAELQLGAIRAANALTLGAEMLTRRLIAGETVLPDELFPLVGQLQGVRELIQLLHVATGGE